MPASHQRIRNTMDAVHTKTKSTLTLRLVVYRKTRMVRLDTVPINQKDENSDEGLCGASEIMLATVNEFRRQMKRYERDARSA